MVYVQALIILAGVLGLWFGSELIVRGSKAIAEKLNISDLIIGLTVVSIGTSIPEIATSIASGLDVSKGITEASGIALGNIIGSHISQITIILGLVALFVTVKWTDRSRKRDGAMMFTAIAILFVIMYDKVITRTEGILLISIYIIYLAYILWEEKLLRTELLKARAKEALTQKKKDQLIEQVEKKVGIHKLPNVPGVVYAKSIIFIIVGLAVVAFAADQVVNNAISLAHIFNIRTSIIGILIGLGTSLPEFSVALTAGLKKLNNLAIGTLIGSNITDPLLSLGSGAVIAGFKVNGSLLRFDMPFWLITTFVVIVLLGREKTLNKNSALLLIGLYVFYLYLNFLLF